MCVCVCVYNCAELGKKCDAPHRSQSSHSVSPPYTTQARRRESRSKSHLFAASDIKLGSVCERREKQIFFSWWNILGLLINCFLF